jgi:RNase adaptor protein for sRNA GlmZ degradation
VDAHVQRVIERKFTHLQVCVGCTGGQHRSVYCAEHVARHLADKFNIKVVLTHRELNTEKML